MRKILTTLIILIIIATLIILGLIFVEGGNNNNNINNNKQPIVSQNNCEIVLDANATTGFSWSYTINNQGIVEVIKDEYVADEADGMVGVGGKQYYEFKGLSAGTAIITLTYKQPWDTESFPAEIAEYSLVVDNNLNVTATKIAPIDFTASKQYEIVLESNASTGFAWSYTMNKEDIVKEVSNEYINPPEDLNLVGASGQQKFVFEGLKAGTVTLNFVYSRTWEKDVEPAKTKEIVLIVDNNLNVTEVIGID